MESQHEKGTTVFFFIKNLEKADLQENISLLSKEKLSQDQNFINYSSKLGRFFDLKKSFQRSKSCTEKNALDQRKSRKEQFSYENSSDDNFSMEFHSRMRLQEKSNENRQSQTFNNFGKLDENNSKDIILNKANDRKKRKEFNCLVRSEHQSHADSSEKDEKDNFLKSSTPYFLSKTYKSNKSSMKYSYPNETDNLEKDDLENHEKPLAKYELYDVAEEIVEDEDNDRLCSKYLTMKQSSKRPLPKFFYKRNALGQGHESSESKDFGQSEL